MRELIIGTRSSKLAIIQTNWIIEELKKSGVSNPFKMKKIDTKGDKNRTVSLPKLGGDGVFLAEIEQELIEGEIDFAVHSLKDIPVEMPEGLAITSIPVREDHRDVLLQKDGKSLKNLPVGAIVGTSSVRRAAQLLAQRPDIHTKWIRGPIDSRIDQLVEGKFDAIVLAAAGLNRLKIGLDFISEYLPAETFVPAMGQGALAIECRKEDKEIKDILAKINDEATEKTVKTERNFLKCFAEGEQAPIGAYAHMEGKEIHLHGMVISLDGETLIEYNAKGTDPEVVAQEAANKLIAQGALNIIADVNEELKKS